MTTLTQPAVTFRRDRFGECWHLVPAGASESTGWLPGVSTSGVAMHDSAGWYRRALATDLATSGVRVLSLAVKNLSPLERADTHAFTRHTLDATDMRIRPFRLPADT